MDQFDIIRLANEYIGNMHTYLKEDQKGKFSIQYRKATNEDVQAENERVRLSFNFKDHINLREGLYTYLMYEDDAIMSDCPTEIISNIHFLIAARRDILILGLGLGIMPLILQQLDKVKTITIIEKNLDVIKLVGDQLGFSRHTKLLQSDAFRYTPTKKFDVIYSDIHSDLNEDTDKQDLILETKYNKYLKDKGKFLKWEQKINIAPNVNK